MTLDELAERTGANVVWLRRLCRAGRLPGASKVGQAWIVDEAAEAVIRAMKYRKGRRE